MSKRIKLERIALPEPVCAGMNILVVSSLVYLYRSTTDDAPAITVRREGKRRYRIVDGRHRLIAAHIAGRRTVLADVVDDEEPDEDTAGGAYYWKATPQDTEPDEDDISTPSWVDEIIQSVPAPKWQTDRLDKILSSTAATLIGLRNHK